MNYISAMKDLSIEDKSILSKYTDDLTYMNDFLNKYKLDMPKTYLNSFCNHLLMLLQRLNTKEELKLEADESMIKDINQENILLSKEFLEPLFKKYKVTKKEMEIALIAIYFQLANGKGETLCQIDH